MKLDEGVIARVAVIPWLARCGADSRPQIRLPTKWLDDRGATLQALFSTQWADATTQAQGQLTGYLAKTDYNTYGSTWNTLLNQSQVLVDNSLISKLTTSIREGAWQVSLGQALLPEITPQVRASIGTQMSELLLAKAWEECLLRKVLINVSRAWLELSYRRRFRRAPIFFERLLEVFEAGRLPCGWEGDLDDWPNGVLLVH